MREIAMPASADESTVATASSETIGSPSILAARMSIGLLLKSLRHRWWTACAFALAIAGAVGAALWTLIPAPYEATAHLHFNGHFPAYVAGKGHVDSTTRLNGYAARLTSDLTAKTLNEDSIRALPTIREQNDRAFEWARSNVRVSAAEGQLSLPIVVTGERPRDLKSIANRLGRNLLADFAKRRQEHEDSLLQELAKLRRELEDELEQIIGMGSGLLPPHLQIVESEANRLNRQISLVETELHELDREPAPLHWVSLSEANVPKARKRTTQIIAAALGSLGTFFFVLFGAAIFEARVRRLTSFEQVADGLGIPVLGAMPRTRSTRRQIHSAESIDAIRTFLLHNVPDGPLVVMVSSAAAGEGKTTIAAQLASSLARSWRKTLLIDGDLREPSAHHHFGLPVEPGFSEVLRSELELGDVIRPTTIARLALMAAGQWDEHVSQALSQEGAHGLVEQLREDYEVIVVDSSPVLRNADTLLLGQCVDTVVLTARRHKSRLPAIHSARQRLAALGIPIRGMVIFS